MAAAQTVPSEPPASLPAETTVAAFFDLDNTVLRGASVFHLAKGLYRREFFTGRDIAAMLWKQVYFSVKGENLNHVAQIREQALGFVAGHSVAEIARIGEEVYDEVMADKIWPGTRALAEGHLESGDDVWLVTASPVEVATVIADRLGLTGALGTVAESVDGIYTGRLVGDAGPRTRQGRGGGGAGERARLRPCPLRRLLGLRQRHPDALPRRVPLRGQPRRRTAPARQSTGVAGPRLPQRPPRGQARHPGRRGHSPRRCAGRGRDAAPLPLSPGRSVLTCAPARRDCYRRCSPCVNVAVIS